nr:helix-turn-helix domain-containing protein [Paenibacillus soyae]
MRIVERNKVFVLMVAPYLVFLVLFMSVGWIVQERTTELLREESVKVNRSLLEQSRTTLDRRLADIDRIAQELYSDSRLTRLQDIEEPFQGATTYLLLDTQKRLASYSLYNNFVFDYFILYSRSGLVLSDDTIYEMPKFYDHVMQIKGQSYEEWRSRWMDAYYSKEVLPAGQVTYNRQPYSLVTVLQSIGNPGFQKGVIAILIDNKEIQKLLGGVDISDGGIAYILDEQGRVVSSVSSRSGERVAEAEAIPVSRGELIGGEGVLEPTRSRPMFVTYTTSEYNGWTYVAAQPEHVILEKADYIKTIFMTILVFALGGGIAISCWLAYRSSRPVQSILNQLANRFGGDVGSRRDIYRLIRDKLAILMDNNDKLESQLKEQAPLLRSAFAERLLKGDITDPEEAAAQSSHVGMELAGAPYYAAVIVQLRGYERLSYHADLWQELGIVRLRFKELLAKALGARGLLHDMAADQIVLLFALSDAREGQCRQELAQLLEQLYARAGEEAEATPILAAGGVYPSLIELARSFEEARQALNYSAWRNQPGIIHYDDTPREHHLYYYPPELQTRLINCAAAGDEQGVARLFDELREANLTNRHLTIPMLRLLFHEVWGTVFKLYAKAGAETQPLLEFMTGRTDSPLGFEALEEGLRQAQQAVEKICRQAGDRKKSGNQALLSRITQLLERAYAEQELCLESAAAELDISRVYLSQFFKEQTGENFSDYLEKVRMNEARRLLLNTRLPIYDIALQVGYSSLNTFGRAFKRMHGLSATTYRESGIGKEGLQTPSS